MPGNLKITRKVPGVKPNYGVPEEFSLFEGEADNRQEVSPAQQALSNPELMTIVFSSLATSSIAKLLPVDDAFYDAGTQLIYHSITLDPSKPFTTAHSPAYTCAITRSQRLEAQTGNRMRKGHLEKIKVLTVIHHRKKTCGQSRWRQLELPSLRVLRLHLAFDLETDTVYLCKKGKNGEGPVCHPCPILVNPSVTKLVLHFERDQARRYFYSAPRRMYHTEDWLAFFFSMARKKSSSSPL